MSILQTAERVSQKDGSDNHVFQRSLRAYVEAAELVNGKVLELGCGMGYGVEIIAPQSDKFISLDKYKSEVVDEYLKKFPNFEFKEITFPPLTGIEDESFDFIVTFQVIEHIKNDDLFLKECHRVLKPGGKLIVSTPNIKMSITRNPWHIREYTIQQLKDLCLKYFKSVDTKGVFGNEKAMDYYEKNKASVKKITRFDIFNLQYNLPRFMLQIPYDILNRMNRKKLMKQNKALTGSITINDFYLDEANDNCLDLFYIATK